MDRGFLVFGDIEETLNELTDEQVGRLFRGMVSYHNTGEKPDFRDPSLKYAFIPIRQQMDRGAEAYQKKCEKNRANALKRSSNVERSLAMAANASDGSLTKTKTNTDTKTKTNTKSTGVDVWSLSFSILSYLNQRAGTSFKTDDAESVHMISDLAHAGYTEDDMRHVIDVKVSDWLGNPVAERYLRPSTLFGSKFTEYLAQPKSADTIRAEKKQERSEANRERAKALQDELDIVKDNLVEADTPTRIRLKEREAWLEDEIRRLTS